MKKTESKDLLIGAHTSAAGGVHRALMQGKEIGATTIQLFTSNQKRWDSRQFTAQDFDLWFEALKNTGLKSIMSHDSYLINLAAPDSEILRKSRLAFAAEVDRCVKLEISYLNFHPGASLKCDPQECLDRIVESLLQMEKALEKGPTRILLENTAGQGSSLGSRFEELAYIIGKVDKKIPIGVCLDTCHLFAAGYDIRTLETWDRTLKEFDQIVGLQHLYAFHMNDSLKHLGSRVDRHAHLGKGLIGLDAFKWIMTDPRTRDLPKYLETPEGPEVWVHEIKMLRGLSEGEG